MSDNLTSIETANEITKRVQVEYSMKDQEIMQLKKDVVINEIKIKELEGDSVIYDNQQECSRSIVSKLHDKKIINIMITALTQSGKTGTMIGLIKNYVNDPFNLIPIEHIYIITGLSSCEWKKQTEKRMPKSIEPRVFHRNDLQKFVKDIKDKKNVLIIIDEIQIAAREEQSLYNSFNECGFYNKSRLLENDIKIIEFSATPDGTIYDLMNWGENASKIMMQPGERYTSCFDLYHQNRVFQCEDLCGSDDKEDDESIRANILEFKEHIDEYDEPRYHLVRTPNALMGDRVVENFKKYIGIDIKCITYDKDNKIEDINTILSEKPDEHVYIFIKEKLRCAKTLRKKHLGILYERCTSSPDDAVIIQGLLGRGTGYDDNGTSIYFTNISSIERYELLWKSNFEDKSVKWVSKTTRRENNILQSSGTYNDPSYIDGMDVVSDDSSEEDEPVIKKFNLFNDAKEYVKNELNKPRGPNNPDKNINSDGFYECTIRSVKKVWSTTQMYKERKCNYKNGAGYGFRYCYSDTTDKSTLEFWIIHI